MKDEKKKPKKLPQGAVVFSALIERLSKAVGCPLASKHLAVLMYGWRKKQPDKAPSFSTLSIRKRDFEDVFLTDEETANLSKYAGYELT